MDYPGEKSCIQNVVGDLSLYVVMGCDGADIIFPGGFEVSRQNLATMVMIMDVAVCFWFIMNTSLLNAFIEREGRHRLNRFVTLPDFAVRIKNLPPQEEYQNLN